MMNTNILRAIAGGPLLLKTARLISAGTILTITYVSACDRAPIAVTTVVQRDSSGVAIMEIPGSVVDAAPSWEVQELPGNAIGRGSSADDVHLLRVTGVHLLPDASIAIGVDASKSILMYNRDGKRVGTLGRTGSGPGEFQHLALVARADPTSIVAHDALQKRVVVYAHGDSVPSTLLLSGMSLGPVLPLYRFANGDLLLRKRGRWPSPEAEGVVWENDRIIRISQGGATLVDFGDHRADNHVVRMAEDGGLTGGEPPYQQHLMAAVLDSSVYVAPAGPHQVNGYRSDGTLASSLRIARQRKAVTKPMIAAYRERVLRNVQDEAGIKEWTMLSTDDVFPKELSGFDQFVIDDSSNFWLRESAAYEDATAQWLLFNRTGTPIGRVTLPAPFMVTDIRSGRVVGVFNDHENPEYVSVYSVRKR